VNLDHCIEMLIKLGWCGVWAQEPTEIRQLRERLKLLQKEEKKHDIVSEFVTVSKIQRECISIEAQLKKKSELILLKFFFF
jgi:hypothetical protein